MELCQLVICEAPTTVCPIHRVHAVRMYPLPSIHTSTQSININFVVFAILDANSLPAESILKADLMRHYDSSVRPTHNKSAATDVIADISLQQIIDVVSLLRSADLPCASNQAIVWVSHNMTLQLYYLYYILYYIM